jgi:hypothetical protein
MDKIVEKQILTIGYYHHNQTILFLGDKMNINIKQTNIQYREIPISQLPDCEHKRTFENMVVDCNKATIIVVAKIGYVGDWSCYIGWPEINQLSDYHKNRPTIQYYCETLRTSSQVESMGDKLDECIAREIFPEWRDLKYRS